MTTAKIVSKMTTAAEAGLEPSVLPLYNAPGATVVAVVELQHIERVQPAPGSETAATVRLRINHLEVAGTEQETTLREAMMALYTLRTASGTLDAAGEIELSERTLRQTGGELTAIEAARLTVGLRSVRARLLELLADPRMTVSGWALETRTLTEAMTAMLHDGADDEDA